MAEVDQVPASVRETCSGPDATTRCGVLGYFTGGPGFIERLVLDSYQAQGILTYLLNALGHHVIKAGVDANIGYYEHIKAYTGRNAYIEQPESTVPGPTAGSQPFAVSTRATRVPRGAGPPVVLDLNNAKSKSVIIGGFVQDSWSILDKVTLNLGLRYDSAHPRRGGRRGPDRAEGSVVARGSASSGIPPRQGRSKIFANYGRYYEKIPLDIADRELTIASGLLAWHDFDCNPLGRTAVDEAATPTPDGGSPNPFAPSQCWRVTAADKVPVDPDLKSPANDEIVAGAEYEVLPNARLGLTYTYRNLVRTVEDMSNDEANTYFIGNPGEGIADTFPKAKRTYHAVTVSFVKIVLGPVARPGQLHLDPAPRKLRRPLPPGDQPARPEPQLHLRSQVAPPEPGRAAGRGHHPHLQGLRGEGVRASRRC